MSARGLTLLETLVAVSIIAALVSLMAPALSSARSAAHQAACASNIRQLQLANDMYASDHDDRYVAGAIDIQTTNLHRWHGRRAHIAEPFRSEAGPLAPYLDDGAAGARTRACPGFASTLESLRASGAGFEHSSGGYGYNNAFVGVTRIAGAGGTWLLESDDHGSARARFAYPTETVAFTDAAFASHDGIDGLIEYSFAEPCHWPDYPEARPNPSIHFRHGGRCNAAWLDGHVSAETRSRTWSGFGYGVDAATVGLGWFGSRDSNFHFDYD